MAEIAYPSTIKTDYDKLCAVYSLIERMRLEHNRQGAIARGDWPKYRDKWYLYALRPKRLGGNVYSELLEPLLKEQNRLRESIRELNFTQEQWNVLPDEDKYDTFVQLFGDKEELKAEPTEASCTSVDSVKEVTLESLEGAPPPDPIEDFTTYTEDDPESVVTVTSSKISWSGLDRPAGTRVYADKGAGHFGDFEHLITVQCSESVGGHYSVYWMLCNSPSGDHYTYPNNSVHVETHAVSNYYRIILQEFDDENNPQYDYTGLLDLGAAYYLTIERDGTDLTCKVYADSERTNLMNTLYLTNVTETTFRYVYGMSSYGGGSGDWDMAGYSENLDLQEAGVTEKTASDSGTGTDIKAGYPGGEITGSESGSGVEYSSLVAVRTALDAGSGVETSILVPIFFSSDAGLGSELARLLKGIHADDGGSGSDALKAIIRAADSSSDMRLHDSPGQARIPSKGVNL